MKYRLISLIAFVFITKSFAQRWEYKSGSNAFDGNYKICQIIGNGENFPWTNPLLEIKLYNSKNVLSFTLSNANTIEPYSIIDIKLVVSREPNTIYSCGALILKNRKLEFVYFINNRSKEKLSNIQFIEKLKAPGKIDMRIETIDDTFDMEFSLIGSEDAINFVLREYYGKQKEAEAKAKAIADAEAKAEADRIAKEKQEQEEKKKKLDALIGGVSKSEGAETGSEGNDDKAGDKGQLDGNPYAASYFGGQGSGSGGAGYGLFGRGRASFKKLTQDCNESGMVIVRIVVNQSGNVISAEPGQKGTTNDAKCLLNTAKKIAMSHKWPADSKAPTRQIGFVSVNFKLSQ